MSFFTSLCGGTIRPSLVLLCLFFASIPLGAQTETTSNLPGPGELTLNTNHPSTNAPESNPTPVLPEALAPVAPPVPPNPSFSEAKPASLSGITANPGSIVLAALMALSSLGGFLLYQCGLTRAKNSGHTSTLLLVAVLFALTGYWIGGFAVQTGGVGDAHAALAQGLPETEQNTLDHELGVMAFGHHWGFMGSSGFFLSVDESARTGIAGLFLWQAAFLAIVVAAALGAALERGRILALAIGAFLVGVLVYPLPANWIWGGGWLAELGHEFGLGHGFVDLGGAAVVHETAGTLALVIAVVLGPRHGRFGRNKSSNAIPGHHVPFLVLGSLILLISWMAANAFAGSSMTPEGSEGLGALNTLLSAAGGMVTTFIVASWQKRRPEPALLCCGLLGGAVASCGCAALIDPWAAFLIGIVASLVIKAVGNYLDRARIDDPSGATAIHGAGGAWGVLATGLFANGTAGQGFNGVTGPVRGLFFGGAWHQLAAQLIGCVTTFAAVCLLGYACLSLVQKLLGNRVPLAAETQGLDLPETGALGYQADVEPEE
jgi:Amt family ammonium transporter